MEKAGRDPAALRTSRMSQNPSPADAVPAAGTARIRVLVVDDHPAFRYGVRELVNRLDDAEVCGEAGDGASALEAFRRLQPDLVMLDIGLPGMNGIELIKMMRAERPDLPVLVLSMHDESFYGLRALRAGARGYLRKDETLKQLGEALRVTARDDFYLSRRFLNQLIRKALHAPEAEGPHALLEGLTDREMEVFQWLGRNLGTRQIARKLGLSIKTIESHRAHIKAKLGLEDAADLVRLAREWHALEHGAAASPDQPVAAAEEVPDESPAHQPPP